MMEEDEDFRTYSNYLKSDTLSQDTSHMLIASDINSE